MKNIYHPITDFNSLPDRSINLFIGKVLGGKYLHTGIVFKANKEAKLFHFAFHKDLRLESIEGNIDIYEKIYFLDFPYFDFKDKKYRRRGDLIAFFETVFDENKNRLPYAFLYKSTRFRKDGKLDPGEGEYGLTCATFVLAVLKRQGINLLKLKTWKARTDDKDFFMYIIPHLMAKIDDDHRNHIQSNPDCVRFRAEEVAGSSTSYPIPLVFERSEKIGAEMWGLFPSQDS